MSALTLEQKCVWIDSNIPSLPTPEERWEFVNTHDISVPLAALVANNVLSASDPLVTDNDIFIQNAYKNLLGKFESKYRIEIVPPDGGEIKAYDVYAVSEADALKKLANPEFDDEISQLH